MKFKKSLLFLGGLSLALLATLPAQASFSFSDFTFFRKDDALTNFHTTEYLNDDGTSAGTGLDAFQQFVHQEASAINLDELNARKLDSTKLRTIADITDLKVYFIHEGAGYRNQLKLNMTGGTSSNGFVFYDGSQGSGSNQLRKGDYVNLGNVAAGTTLDFSLLANGYGNTNFHTYYADVALNPDNLQHVMAYEYQDYLILAWEDLYNGGDKDYNDIVFAVNLGAENLDQIPTDPVTNQAPAAQDDNVEVPSNSSILIDVMANDTDPDGDMIFLIEADGLLSEGTVEIEGTKVLYTPASGAAVGNSDTFTYTIEDTSGVTDSAVVSINVTYNAD
ncbi:MAG: DUF4114 domain-containing protein [Cyanobacteria bacterium P01_A01_bin.40]